MPTTTPLRLHIGGKEPREGWKILNIQPGPAVDFVGNVTDLSAFADLSVAEIYASHVLEHLGYRDELLHTLTELHRILAPGGWLRISVPDLECLSRLFVHPKAPPKDRYLIMRMMFGGQTDPYDVHKVGLYWDYLSDLLREAGFAAVERIERHGLFDDASEVKVGGVLISLNVQARK